MPVNKKQDIKEEYKEIPEGIDPDAIEMDEETEKVLEEDIAAKAEQLSQGSVLHEALASQVQLRSIKEIELDMKKPIHQKLILTLKFGKMKGAKYIHWVSAERYASLYMPGWSKKETVIPDALGVSVVVEVSVPTKEGTVTRSGVGWKPYYNGKNADGTPKETQFGGPACIAARQGLKRALASYGLAQNFYTGD
jgi:hypothetical protein